MNIYFLKQCCLDPEAPPDTPPDTRRSLELRCYVYTAFVLPMCDVQSHRKFEYCVFGNIIMYFKRYNCDKIHYQFLNYVLTKRFLKCCHTSNKCHIHKNINIISSNLTDRERSRLAMMQWQRWIFSVLDTQADVGYLHTRYTGRCGFSPCWIHWQRWVISVLDTLAEVGYLRTGYTF